MTITEAHAVNVLARWIIGREPWLHGADGPRPTDEEAREALEVLAGYSYKALSAGWSPERLRELWPKRELGRTAPTAAPPPPTPADRLYGLLSRVVHDEVARQLGAREVPGAEVPR